MTEWAEGEETPSLRDPRAGTGFAPILKAQTATDSLPSLANFATLDEPWLRELVDTTIELDRISHSIERPQLDEEWLDGSAATTLSIRLYLPFFCTSVREMPSWPASTTNANTGARKHRSPTSSFPCNPRIRRAYGRHSCIADANAGAGTHITIQNLIDEREKQICDSASMSEANSN